MTIMIALAPPAGPATQLTASPADHPSKRRPGHRPPEHNPDDYRDILRKKDDRLIRDIGLTRAEILGPERTFWSEWLKRKAPWQC